MSFAPFAEDLAGWIARFVPARILALGAGTEVVAREVTRTTPGVEVVATDLNPARVSHGQAHVLTAA